MNMKRMSLFMYYSRCFAWLYERSRNFSSIAVIHDDMASGVVSSASPIASDMMKLRPWRGGQFGCDRLQDSL